MSKTRESGFRRSVERYLPKHVHRQGMGGTATNGTWDSYYETLNGILWIEWKYTKTRMPRVFPELGPLQLAWGRRAYENCIPAAVVCGSPSGAWYAVDLEWERNVYIGPLDRKTMAGKIVTWVKTGEVW